MGHTDRRGFLRKTLVAPLGVIAGQTWARNHCVETEYSTVLPLPAKIKVSLNAWSYNVPLFKYVRGEEGGMSLFDLLEECARLDFDAVDPTGYFFPGYPEVPSSSFISQFKRRAFQLGLDISGTGIRNDFSTADRTKRRNDIDLAKRWVEAAAEIGAPVLRVFAGKKPDEHEWDEVADWLAEALAECAEHGEKYGVMIGVQNHGDMLSSADEVIDLLGRVESDWLGVIVDTGYFLTPDPYDDIARVIPYAVNWQVKELLKNREGGEIDLPRLVKIVRDSAYRGYLPIETLPIKGAEDQYDAYVRVPLLLDKLRAALQ
ncbi:MAG: sugar phosphate isomerase/epimerase [Saprospiraceae bacterium]|nr:sugar phosphate isomerase/epimerase [Saprospiraceae bacterium]